MEIPFRKLYNTKKELEYIEQVISNKLLSGNGAFCVKCENYIQKKYNFPFVTLTSSCTAALEMTAILMDIQEGDEVIIPSYTFVSSANAFALRGAKIIFGDSSSNNPNIDIEQIENLITSKTKAIVIVHYAGFSVDMEKITSIIHKHQLFLIEDAAMAFNSYYKNKPLGSFGHFATFSFHETKNITSGKGGLLVINDLSLITKAYSIRDKGTNRQDYKSGKVSKYEWVSLGSSYSLSELQAAFLLAQLEKSEIINNQRLKLWNIYYENLKFLEEKQQCQIPNSPSTNFHNGSIFYLVFESLKKRQEVINYLSGQGIQTAFHYQALHKSPFYLQDQPYKSLPLAEHYSESLLRLPLFYEMTKKEIYYVINKIKIVNKIVR